MAKSANNTDRLAYAPRIPQDLEAERSVLGSMLINANALDRALELLNESCFFNEQHRIVFSRITELMSENKPVDVVSLAEILTRHKELDKVGGRIYLLSLVDNVITPSNIDYYSNIVLEKAIRRKLIEASTQTIQRCYDSPDDIEALLDIIEAEIFNIAEERIRGGFLPLGETLLETYSQITEIHNQRGGTTGVQTGFDRLDEFTLGFQKSDLIIIAGRPSMGKTALALDIAANIAVKEDKPLALFSLEMSRSQLAMRFLAKDAKVDFTKMRAGKLSNADFKKLQIHFTRLKSARLFIDDTPNLSVLEIRAKTRRLKRREDIGLVIIDYLQLMKSEARAENRQQEIAQISRSLKGLARELDIPVVCLSQLSRQVEMRSSKRPQLADLRESGAIEQDADVVIFIYRPEQYDIKVDDKGYPTEGVAEIIIGKQRNGSTGSFYLTFRKEYVSFENLSRYEEQPQSSSDYGGAG
ncbi:replicative DNA helicase [bacterium]|nr:replicative DNA helicase [bacterium]